MKSNKEIAFFIAFIAVLCLWLIIAISHVTLSILSFVFLFIVVFLLAYFVIKQYIEKRIKTLYRIIQNQKIKSQQHFDLESSEEDVKKWVSERQAEIEHLKDTEKFRRDFLGNVSHELKTPIFNIQGYVLTLLEGALEDEQINKKYLQRTQKSVERMISIVEDLESISTLEHEEKNLKIEKFDIVELCKNVQDSLEDKAKKSNISLVFDKEYSPIFVVADKMKINQVLTNLVDNSIKYGNENGLTKIRFYDMVENILVEVSDDGIGIDEIHLPRLSERFFRVEESRSREKGGTGLGLSIVKHIIESHKQTLNIRSTVGVGSTFSFTLKKAK
ncbi:MAG: sensor histidine kinase [Flavobacteriales bacterium]|nr:sensor histidine kinase [Flavobacteriales bacterium]